MPILISFDADDVDVLFSLFVPNSRSRCSGEDVVMVEASESLVPDLKSHNTDPPTGYVSAGKTTESVINDKFYRGSKN